MIELKDISTMEFLKRLKEHSFKEVKDIYEYLVENDVRDYQRLKDLYEEAKIKKRKEGINNPLLFMSVVSGEIYSVESQLEKSNNKKEEKKIFNTCEDALIFPHTYNQKNVDKTWHFFRVVISWKCKQNFTTTLWG